MKKVILDTDFGNVYDDAAALSMLHAFADQGKIELVATVTNMGHPYSTGALSSFNTYFGREEIPVGGVDADEMNYDDAYAAEVVETYPGKIKTYTEALPAVPLLRKVLSESEDHSITYIAIGATNILRNLLESLPDESSPLSGKELIAKKIDILVIMGGSFDPTVKRTDNPNGVAEGWTYNWSEYDPKSSQFVFENWPTPIEILTSEAGYVIRTGKSIYNDDLLDNPVRMAYDKYAEKKQIHKTIDGAWDQLTMLLAVNGYDDRWEVVTDGACVVDENGLSSWDQSQNKHHSYGIIKPEFVQKVADECDRLMVEALYRRQKKENSSC